MTSEELNKIKDHLISPKAEIRKKALVELKKLSVHDAMELLIPALAVKNDDIRADLIKVFKSFKDSALPHLVKAFSHSSWVVRETASRIIGSLGDSYLAKFLELIPGNEEDPDYWMVQTLSLMGGDAVPYLVKAFHHQNNKIRLSAIRASVNTRDPRIVAALLPLLEEDNWPIRKAAFDSLLEVHSCNPEALNESLKQAAREAKYWVVKIAAEKHDPSLIPYFTDIIEHDEEELKLEAIKALALIETRDVQKLLVGYLAHKSWIVRKAAADAIWQQGLGVSEELLSAVHAPSSDARYWSVKLLGQSNEPKAFDKVLDRLGDTHPSVRAAACQALGTLGDKRALAPLMTLLSDASEEVRTSAILAIGQIGEKDKQVNEKPSIPRHLLPENQIACPHCGKKVGRNFSFCPFCLGHLKPLSCRKCSLPLQSEWKGCPNCGEPT